MIDLLYKNIKSRRRELHMSQDELASQLGYKSRSSISRIEAGEVDLPQSKIAEFANVLNTTPRKLMGWDKEDEISNTLSDKEKKDIAKQVEKIVEELDSNCSLKSLLGGSPLTGELRDIVRKRFQTTFEFARIKAKEKFIPNKCEK